MLAFTERGDGGHIRDHVAACVAPFAEIHTVAHWARTNGASMGNGFQELLVDQFHEPQVLSTLAFWGVIQI